MARTRAFRRHQYAVRKERVKHRFYSRWLPGKWLDGRWLGLHAASPKLCSGYCCGNPRKWFGEKTIQERKADLALKDEW